MGVAHDAGGPVQRIDLLGDPPDGIGLKRGRLALRIFERGLDHRRLLDRRGIAEHPTAIGQIRHAREFGGTNLPAVAIGQGGLREPPGGIKLIGIDLPPRDSRGMFDAPSTIR